MKIWWWTLGLVLVAGSTTVRGEVGFSTRLEEVRAPGFPVVQTTVQVFTREAAADLSSDDFRVAEEGKAVSDLRVEVDRRPVYLSLVLDQSGSMRGSMPHLKQAAFDFLDGMDEGVRCQLVSFATEVHRQSGFRRDKRPVKKTVSGLKAGGATRLYDAIDAALEDLSAFPHEVRRVIVVFTDGRDERSKNGPRLSEKTAKAVAKRAWRQGVPLYFLGLGKGVQRKLLQKLSSATGGEAIFSPDSKALRAAFARMARSLRTAYRLQYTSPNPKSDGSVRKLQVTSRHRGQVDQGRGKYRAPKPTPGADLRVVRARQGCAVRGQVLGALAGLRSYQVEVQSEVSGVPLDDGTSESVATRVSVLQRANQGEEVRVNLTGSRGGLDVRVVSTKTGSYVEVGGADGQKLQTAIKGPAAVSLKNPVRQIFGWLGSGDTRGGACEGVRLARPGVLWLRNGGILHYSVKTYLPVRLVTVNSETGSASTVTFGAWKTGDLRVLPDISTAVAAGVAAERFATQTALASLRVAGLAMGTGMAATEVAVQAGNDAVDLALIAGLDGVEAGLRGAEAGLAGAEAGIAGAELGMDAARQGLTAAAVAMDVTRQFALPLSTKAAEGAVRTAGALVRMVGSREFVEAAMAPAEQSMYFARVAVDEAAYAAALGESATLYAQDMTHWSEQLTLDLTSNTEQFEREILDYVDDVTDAALGAGEVALETGELATEVGLEAGEAAIEIGEDAAELGEAAGEMGRDLGSLGRDLGSLGRDLGDLGRKLGGGW